jgi:hypothetical protein
MTDRDLLRSGVNNLSRYPHGPLSGWTHEDADIQHEFALSLDSTDVALLQIGGTPEADDFTAPRAFPQTETISFRNEDATPLDRDLHVELQLVIRTRRVRESHQDIQAST